MVEVVTCGVRRTCCRGRSTHTLAAKCYKCWCILQATTTYSSLAFWGVAKETAMRTDAALTAQTDTPPGTKETPEGMRVTVELVVYMNKMSHSKPIRCVDEDAVVVDGHVFDGAVYSTAVLLTMPLCPQQTSPVKRHASPLPPQETPHT